jgi:hypothetical protein
MMRLRWIVTFLLAFASATPFPAQVESAPLSRQSHPNDDARTRVIVLGVDHAAQLVSPANQPAVLAAFMGDLHPAAICVERPPEQAERRDFYEFTYEVQDVVLPFVASHPTDTCPVDWMPSIEDQKLVFGSNLDDPPEIRPKRGFQAFLVFPDPKVLNTDIFFADDPAATERVRKWSANAAASMDQDFPRRLYLYRTFMQAQRIRAAAAAHRGQTVLVVVGYFHKPDLEAILSHDSNIQLVQPSSLGHPAAEAVNRATTRANRVAVLSFNLLGRQAETGNVNWQWIERVLLDLEAESPNAEARLFRARFNELKHLSKPRETIDTYRAIVNDAPRTETFTWTGVKDPARLDSFFDPFGNVSIRQRANIELARMLFSNGAAGEASQILNALKSELGERKARQLDAYAANYLRPVR